MPSIEILNRGKKVITITMGDCAENHVRMQKIECADSKKVRPFTVSNLREICENFNEKFGGNSRAELIDLSLNKGKDEAAVLIIRNFLSEETHISLFEEMVSLNWDKKAMMYGRVVEKRARSNLCFSENAQEPVYEEGKGRIVAWNEVPKLYSIVQSYCDFFEPHGVKVKNLVGEGNYYEDKDKCGIGFHGDAERIVVVGLRIGGMMPIVWRWFKNSEPISEAITVNLNGGDLYIMSEKAVGTDWKKRSIPTLRHAAGAQKYTLFQKKKKTSSTN